jgi:hypothetical protein
MNREDVWKVAVDEVRKWFDYELDDKELLARLGYYRKKISRLNESPLGRH